MKKGGRSSREGGKEGDRAGGKEGDRAGGNESSKEREGGVRGKGRMGGGRDEREKGK